MGEEKVDLQRCYAPKINILLAAKNKDAKKNVEDTTTTKDVLIKDPIPVPTKDASETEDSLLKESDKSSLYESAKNFMKDITRIKGRRKEGRKDRRNESFFTARPNFLALLLREAASREVDF